MKCGTPKGHLISTEANLQAPSFATVMDGPEAAPARKMGDKPVPAKTCWMTTSCTPDSDRKANASGNQVVAP